VKIELKAEFTNNEEGRQRRSSIHFLIIDQKKIVTIGRGLKAAARNNA
jgi:hypothetical protein